jgi:hypothetical protein
MLYHIIRKWIKVEEKEKKHNISRNCTEKSLQSACTVRILEKKIP